MDNAKKLSEDHWKYIKEVLTQHGVPGPEQERVGFHYKAAFIHGYKHGQEQLIEMYKEQKFGLLKKENNNE